MQPPLAILDNLGVPELLVCAVIALMLFGKEMPAVSRKIGMMLAQFKRGMAEASAELNREMDEAARTLEDEKKKKEEDKQQVTPETGKEESAVPAAAGVLTPELPPVAPNPMSDALALDSNAGFSPHVTAPPPPAEKPTSLDVPQPPREIRLPSKIPPPIA